MTKKTAIAVGCAALMLVVGVGTYLSRGLIRDWIEMRNRPVLPAAVPFDEVVARPSVVAPAPPSPIEGGTAKSEHFVLESSPQQQAPPSADLLEAVKKIPDQINLAVPWMSQAPDANWEMPYQEACEEASVIMMDAFYRKQSKIPVAMADQAIKDLVDYENKTIGYYKDTDAETTVDLLRDYFKYKDVRIVPFATADEIKAVVGRGFPVIIPFYGKALKNPNFHDGGPLYHMLVVKGYTVDGQFITDDPGTRKGADYLYAPDLIVAAAHDWNGGNVTEGRKVMIVVLPNPPPVE